MGLLVYRLRKYSHPQENEQYREVCQKLKNEYCSREDLCLFIANYRLRGCEYDGILIKNDSVISVEFKNYGGNITAEENGHWKLSDGTIIKGGSGKTPYLQAQINRSHLLKFLQVKHVSALIVFNKRIIELNNKLSEYVKCWLHITDNDHFLQKVYDITSDCLDLSNNEIIGLVNKFELHEEWLDKEYSTLSPTVDFIADNGESYSLIKDTDNGKEAPLELVHKYIKVVDDEISGNPCSSKDIIKHFHSAVKLIMQSLTNDNPVLDLLNVYCILTLQEFETDNDVRSILENSYLNAYKTLWNMFENKSEFYKYISEVKNDMFEHGVYKSYAKELEYIELYAEMNRYSAMINDLSWKI